MILMQCLGRAWELNLGPELYNFLSYWRALGGGDVVPARQLLDLRRLTSNLRWMFILEMDGDGTLRFRLAGSSLEEVVGVGMTDRTYGTIFEANADGGIAEEIYALSIVRGCGVLKCGRFSVDKKSQHALEVLALPFADERALGGTVLVGVIAPVSMENIAFEDRREHLSINIDDMFLLPSPNLITPQQITQRLSEKLTVRNVDLRVLDMEQIFNQVDDGLALSDQNLPSFRLEIAAAAAQDIIN